jgi:putative two-component system response regulator
MTPTILLVTSDPERQASWKHILTEQGYRTVTIGHGERALDLCPHLQPDLVLMDAALPDVPGLEICRRLKMDPRNDLTPVLLITGLAGEHDKMTTLNAGVDDVWGSQPTRWEALARVQSLIQLKTYIDQQADAVVASLASTIEARDAYTRGHCERIAFLAVRLGMKIGLTSDQLETLRVAGIVHDIGKVFVPDSILLKSGPLTLQETIVMRQHPVEGERICAPLKCLRRVLPVIRHHHERMDGSGYPDGLREDAIPLSARVLQIADIYDALTTDRPYREALSPGHALSTLYGEADRGWLDKELVRVFAGMMVSSGPAKILDGKKRIGKPRFA